MTTEHRDTARRCDRCQRVTLGTAVVGVTFATRFMLAKRLCLRCRHEVLPMLSTVIGEPSADVTIE